MPGNMARRLKKDKMRGAEVKVLLVDDSVEIQQSFGTLLQTAPGVAVVGYADDVASALAFISANHCCPRQANPADDMLN